MIKGVKQWGNVDCKRCLVCSEKNNTKYRTVISHESLTIYKTHYMIQKNENFIPPKDGNYTKVNFICFIIDIQICVQSNRFSGFHIFICQEIAGCPAAQVSGWSFK